MRRSFSLILTCAATLMLADPAQALPEDREQPISIEADQALRDEKQGFTRYQGNVVLDQGTLHIEADMLTVFHVDEDASRIEARGQPATMRQQPSLDKGMVHAHALIIEYFRNEERVQLQNDARIEQEGSIVTGDLINYYIDEELVRAGSNNAEDGSRVKTIIAAQAVQRVREEDNDKSADDPNNPPAADDPNQAVPADPNGPMAADDPNQPRPENADGAADSE